MYPSNNAEQKNAEWQSDEANILGWLPKEGAWLSGVICRLRHIMKSNIYP